VFSDVNDWGSGFTGALVLTNQGTSAINGWTLQFDFAPAITQIWNAAIVSHTGTHYVIQNASYNATIAPGQSVNIGFNGAPGHLTSGPTGYILNGVSLGGSSNGGAVKASAVSPTALVHPRLHHEHRVHRHGGGRHGHKMG
jgi:hypothetical protein